MGKPIISGVDPGKTKPKKDKDKTPVNPGGGGVGSYWSGGGGSGSSTSTTTTKDTTVTKESTDTTVNPDVGAQGNALAYYRAQLANLNASMNDSRADLDDALKANQWQADRDIRDTELKAGNEWYKQQQELQSAYTNLRQANGTSAYGGAADTLNWLASREDDEHDTDLLNQVRENKNDILQAKHAADVEAISQYNSTMSKNAGEYSNAISNFFNTWSSLMGSRQKTGQTTKHPGQETTSKSKGSGSSSTVENSGTLVNNTKGWTSTTTNLNEYIRQKGAAVTKAKSKYKQASSQVKDLKKQLKTAKGSQAKQLKKQLAAAEKAAKKAQTRLKSTKTDASRINYSKLGKLFGVNLDAYGRPVWQRMTAYEPKYVGTTRQLSDIAAEVGESFAGPDARNFRTPI